MTAQRDLAAELRAVISEMQGWNSSATRSIAVDNWIDRLSALAEAAPGEPVAWLYPNEERNLGAHGTALVYQQKQVFSLLPHEDGLPLYASPPLAPERADTLKTLSDLMRGYVSLLETGRERILFHGGTCDSVEVMERDDPYLRQARAAIAAMQADKGGKS